MYHLLPHYHLFSSCPVCYWMWCVDFPIDYCLFWPSTCSRVSCYYKYKALLVEIAVFFSSLSISQYLDYVSACAFLFKTVPYVVQAIHKPEFLGGGIRRVCTLLGLCCFSKTTLYLWLLEAQIFAYFVSFETNCQPVIQRKRVMAMHLEKTEGTGLFPLQLKNHI